MQHLICLAGQRQKAYRIFECKNSRFWVFQLTYRATECMFAFKILKGENVRITKTVGQSAIGAENGSAFGWLAGIKVIDMAHVVTDPVDRILRPAYRVDGRGAGKGEDFSSHVS
jgi:hypothetical protein